MSMNTSTGMVWAVGSGATWIGASPSFTTTAAETIAATASDVTFQMDEEAFRGFYERTARMLWAYLHRMTGDAPATDDLLQEV